MPRDPDTSAARVHRRAFDPEAHRVPLRAIIAEVVACEAAESGAPHGALTPAAMDDILRRHPRDGRGFFSRSEIIAGFRHWASDQDLGLDEESFVRRVRLRPVRTRSGVTPLTVLTRPHPCPGKCVFCPDDPAMPKSYLSDEPGAQRAAVNRFDPYLQVWNRLDAYRAIGHPIDKVELIVLGGTWSSYPEPYQVGFTQRCFEAMNDYGAGIDRRVEAEATGPEGGTGWEALAAVQRVNEDARCRSVGLVLETRPDHVTEREVLRLRRLGCTKVQIGYQSLSDEVLEANRRGHDVATTRRAMTRLRRAGFKIHAHWMPNLLASTPEADVADFLRVFADPGFRPDELKIYPCSLIETAELMKHYERGDWRPYEHDELLFVLTEALAAVPRYCRVTRVIRDISSDDIVAGNKLTNFRQIAERELSRQGRRCLDIRAREIGAERVEPGSLRLRITRYETSTGREAFLEYVRDDDRIVAFLRLALPDGPSFVAEIEHSALIREVHVYGPSVELGTRPGVDAQHRGLGQQLIERAMGLASEAGFEDVAVISAVGTRGYYRRFGFVDGELYQHRRSTLAT